MAQCVLTLARGERERGQSIKLALGWPTRVRSTLALAVVGRLVVVTVLAEMRR